MQVWEGVILAMQQLRSEKLKSFFSLIGVILGVMFLIVVVTIIEGLDRYVREEVTSQVFGVSTVTLRRWPEVDINSRRGEVAPSDASTPTSLRGRRSDSCPTHDPSTNRNPKQLRRNGSCRQWSHCYWGATDRSISLRSSPFATSRLTVVELSLNKKQPPEPQSLSWVLRLPKSFSKIIDPIGHTVRLRGFPYRVIGVLEERGSLFGMSLDNFAVAPHRSPIQAVLNPPGIVDEVIIQTVNPDRLLEAQMEAEGIMRTRRLLRPSETNNFALETADDAISFWDNISRILFTALPGLVAISLVVGGIVIMNIMLVSVMERTREIGVRKALGARRRDILTQVLIESATLSTVGAIFGVLVGIGIATLVASFSPMPAAVSAKWVALGVTLGLSVGIVAGVYPAFQASKLDPVDALRYE